jgi:hypothetical protein
MRGVEAKMFMEAASERPSYRYYQDRLAEDDVKGSWMLDSSLKNHAAGRGTG